MDSGRSAVHLPSGSEVGHDEARTLVLRFLRGDIQADPYPALNRLREAGPVWLGDGVVVLSSYAHCAAALRAADPAPASAGVCPVHLSRLHGVLRRALSTQAVADLAPLVRTLVDDRLDSVAARGRLDVVSDLAHPVPLAVLSRLLGLPDGDARWLHRRLTALGTAPLLPLADTGGPSVPAARCEAETELETYLAAAVRGRRLREDSGDLLSRLVRADGGRLTDAEAAAAGRFLLASGYETTAALVSGGVLALLRAPHEIDALRRDPGHAVRLVEETLRVDPPMQIVRRRAGADLNLCGVRVPRGTVLLLLLGAAHRDPELTPHPDVFTPDGVSPHLGFGADPHHCVGAPLARLVAQTVLVRFAQRVAGPRFAVGSTSYRPSAALRGLRALWVDADGFADRDLPWQPAAAGPPAPPSAAHAARTAAGRTS
ncbi:cytochrome P450 [Streptomyces bungoensis]|uniref:cytochrome P450 n=1 Tax=Streptomyces bungoensis TaxID=285568 RepID=UPI00099E8213|nr:cytochrome P450 [Streptomyces bungoensis]